MFYVFCYTANIHTFKLVRNEKKMVNITFASDCCISMNAQTYTQNTCNNDTAAMQPVSYRLFYYWCDFQCVRTQFSCFRNALINTSKLPVVCCYYYFLLLLHYAMNWELWFDFLLLFLLFFLPFSDRCYTIKQVPLQKNSTNLSCLMSPIAKIWCECDVRATHITM